MIQSDFRSGTKKSRVVRNPTPPKNLRLRNPVENDGKLRGGLLQNMIARAI